MNSRTIPLFLTAKTKEELVKVMFKNSQRLSHYVKYFDIQYVDGMWVAWFEFDALKVKNGFEGR